ncbi:MAG: hypothetical protein AB1567_07690 [bacterium]
MKILKSGIKYGLGILILCIGIVILFQTHPSQAGIPLENPKISQEQARQMYEEIKRQKEEIMRRNKEEKQKKKEEAERKKQLIKEMEAPKPTPEEETPSAKKEEAKKIEEEAKPIPTPTQEAKGIVPGVVTTEEEIEQAKEIEKREKVAREVKHKRNLSFILTAVVMLATIIFLIRSMYKGRHKDEEKKK